MYVLMYVCMYVCMYVGMYIHMYLYLSLKTNNHFHVKPVKMKLCINWLITLVLPAAAATAAATADVLAVCGGWRGTAVAM